jgi:hypothetical protein
MVVCVRGSWESFDVPPMSREVRAAVADEAAGEFHGFTASRRTQGIGADGQRRSGVAVDERTEISTANPLDSNPSRSRTPVTTAASVRLQPSSSIRA